MGKSMNRFGICLIGSFVLPLSFAFAQQPQEATSPEYKKVFRFSIEEEIAAPAAKLTEMALEESKAWGADLVLVEMDTYGGAVDAADEIRTALLSHSTPVWVFVKNNAASAGAFIALACDSIFMRPGATMGAATVVGPDGEKVDEKYQSFMRAKMRETAERNGRNPNIAEAMVDGSVVVPGVNDSGKVVSLTSSEALDVGFSEGTFQTVEDILEHYGLQGAKQNSYQESSLSSVVRFFMRPAVSGILVTIIFLGLIFELQTPGVGLAGAAALGAAVLYFIPNYLEGLAESWEILLFLVGLILIALEIFVIPGFGVAGVLGGLFTLTSLVLAVSGTVESKDFSFPIPDVNQVVFGVLMVGIAFFASTGIALLLGYKLIGSALFRRVEVASVQRKEDGYTAQGTWDPKQFVGQHGETETPMRPGGTILLNGNSYEAVSLTGWLDSKCPIKVTGYTGFVLEVVPLDEASPKA